MTDIPLELLKSLLSYDARTGKLYWNERPVSMFPSDSRQSQKQCAHNWNTRYAGTEAGNITARGYVQIGVFRRLYKAHRVAWYLHYGTWPSENIDHINGDSADNRIANLRDVPQRLNGKNLRMSRKNSSGVCGVCHRASTGKWLASITYEGVQKHIGSFNSRSEAAEARRAAEQKNGFHPNHGKPRIPKEIPKSAASD